MGPNRRISYGKIIICSVLIQCAGSFRKVINNSKLKIIEGNGRICQGEYVKKQKKVNKRRKVTSNVV